jgi:hypothetical protein
MADHAAPQYSMATGNDYPEHEATYHRVMKLTKVGTATIVVGLVAMTIGLIGLHGWIMVIGLALTGISMVIGLASKNGRIGPLVGSLIVMLILWILAG